MIRAVMVKPEDLRLVHRPFDLPARLAAGLAGAVNFSFFAPGATPVPVGGVAVGGKLLVAPAPSWPTLYLERGRARIGPWSDAQALGADLAVQGGPQVATDFQPCPWDQGSFPGTQLGLALPRTGAGIRPDGRVVLAVSQAATADDMAGYFLMAGCRDAMLADGGGSSAFVERGRAIVGGARKVPNVVGWTAAIPLDVVGVDVTLDPGHGGSDPGVVGHGLREADLNVDVATRVGEYLDRLGITWRLTRAADVYRSLAHRVTLSTGCDLFVSIHHNWDGSQAASGLEVYHYPGTTGGYQAARAVEAAMRVCLGLPSRGVKAARYYVLRETEMPAILTEAGFLSSPADAGQLRWEWFRDREALAIAVAVARHFQKL